MHIQDDEQFMRLAIEQAHVGMGLGEIPVGCVIVRDGEVIAKGHNLRESKKTALGHAEIMAIEIACQKLGDWRLADCTIYVTLEPCPMCMGAILGARLTRVVFGANDERSGCCGSLIQLADCGFEHRPPIRGGVLDEACANLLSSFFKERRKA